MDFLVWICGLVWCVVRFWIFRVYFWGFERNRFLGDWNKRFMWFKRSGIISLAWVTEVIAFFSKRHGIWYLALEFWRFPVAKVKRYCEVFHEYFWKDPSECQGWHNKAKVAALSFLFTILNEMLSCFSWFRNPTIKLTLFYCWSIINKATLMLPVQIYSWCI